MIINLHFTLLHGNSGFTTINYPLKKENQRPLISRCVRQSIHQLPNVNARGGGDAHLQLYDKIAIYPETFTDRLPVSGFSSILILDAGIAAGTGRFRMASDN